MLRVIAFAYSKEINFHLSHLMHRMAWNRDKGANWSLPRCPGGLPDSHIFHYSLGNDSSRKHLSTALELVSPCYRLTFSSLAQIYRIVLGAPSGHVRSCSLDRTDILMQESRDSSLRLVSTCRLQVLAVPWRMKICGCDMQSTSVESPPVIGASSGAALEFGCTPRYPIAAQAQYHQSIACPHCP